MVNGTKCSLGLGGILVRAFLKELSDLIKNEMLSSAFKASDLPENKTSWNSLT